MKLTEDQVKELAREKLGLEKVSTKNSGIGQHTSFKFLGFNGFSGEPDAWYIPKNINYVAIVLEAKNSDENISLKKWENEIVKNIKVFDSKYKNVIGILFFVIYRE